MLLLSATGFAFNNAASCLALQYTEALNALLIQSSAPLFVAIWALLLFGVRLTSAQLAGIVISLAGVLTIILRGDASALATIRTSGTTAGHALMRATSARRPHRAAPKTLKKLKRKSGAKNVEVQGGDAEGREFHGRRRRIRL
jgi:EamA domain-containing membrane protein RarD